MSAFEEKEEESTVVWGKWYRNGVKAVVGGACMGVCHHGLGLGLPLLLRVYDFDLHFITHFKLH